MNKSEPSLEELRHSGVLGGGPAANRFGYVRHAQNTTWWEIACGLLTAAFFAAALLNWVVRLIWGALC